MTVFIDGSETDIVIAFGGADSRSSGEESGSHWGGLGHGRAGGVAMGVCFRIALERKGTFERLLNGPT